VHWFEALEEAKAKIEAWRVDYNESRPHQALAELAPAEFAARARDLETTTRPQAAENQPWIWSGKPKRINCPMSASRLQSKGRATVHQSSTTIADAVVLA
jgi:hypothetical protein